MQKITIICIEEQAAPITIDLINKYDVKFNAELIAEKNTVDSWEKILDHNILDYDGFRNIKKDTLINYDEYIKGYVQCTTKYKTQYNRI